jgi:hypothetical protein
VKKLKDSKLIDNLEIDNFQDTLNEKFNEYLIEKNNQYIKNYYNYKIIQDLLYNID